jgi:hypothetical protein
MQTPKSPIGIIGWAIVAYDFLRFFVAIPPIRRVLMMSEWGQAIDFAIEHFEKPGWLGNPYVQFGVLVIGLALIFWDVKRPQWLPSPEIGPRKMIVGGLVIIVIGVVVVGIGLWRQPTVIVISEKPGSKPLSTLGKFDPIAAAQKVPAASRQKEREVIESILPEFSTATNEGIRGLIDKMEYFESAASYVQMGKQSEFLQYARSLLELYKGKKYEFANFSQQHRLYSDVVEIIQFPNDVPLEDIMISILARAEDFGPEGRAKNTERMFLDLKEQMHKARMELDKWRAQSDANLIALHRELGK